MTAQRLIGYRTLVNALQRLRDRSRVGQLTIGHVLDDLGAGGYCLLSITIALPFLLPFLPLGPFSTAGGLAFIVLGSQLLRGFREPVLPERVRRLPVAPPVLGSITRLSLGFLRWWRRHTRVRHTTWVTGRKGRLALGTVILVAGLIMVIPFFGIPLNDFFPALAVVSVCVGELEQDGLMVLVALGWLLVGALYCTALILAVAILGWGAVQALFG